MEEGCSVPVGVARVATRLYLKRNPQRSKVRLLYTLLNILCSFWYCIYNLCANYGYDTGTMICLLLYLCCAILLITVQMSCRH